MLWGALVVFLLVAVQGGLSIVLQEGLVGVLWKALVVGLLVAV